MRRLVALCGATLAASTAAAAVAPSAPPVITAQQQQAVAAEERTRAPQASPRVLTGEWEPVFQRPAPAQEMVVTGTVADVYLGAPAFNANIRKVALRINDGLDHVGEDVAPALADEAGLDHLDIIDGSYTIFDESGDCNRYRLKLRNVWIEMPFGPDALDGHFETGKEVKADFDLPAADAHAEIEWTITNISSAGWCWLDPIPAMDIEAEFTVGDLLGELDLTLETSGSAIQVDTIDHVSFEVGDFAWDTNSWFLDTVIALGFSLYDLFDGCSGQAECLSDAINQHALSRDELVDAMTAVVNDVIDAPLTITGGNSSDGLSLGFTVSLDSVKSSTTHDTFTSIWNVALSSTGATDSCANALTVRSFLWEGTPGNESLTNDHMELELPYHLVSKAAYYAGKQGLFCQSFIANNLFIRTFELQPNGSIAVSGALAGEPANTVRLTLPVKAAYTGSGIPSGSITGTVTLVGELSIDGGSDLNLNLVDAEVSNLAGTVTVGPVVISAASLSDEINDVADDIVADVGDIELLNAVVDTGIGGLSVAVDEITHSGSAFVVGLDFQ